jgi:hypothetical protein
VLAAGLLAAVLACGWQKEVCNEGSLSMSRGTRVLSCF